MRFYWRSLPPTHGPSIGRRQQQPFRSTSQALEAYWHMCSASTVHLNMHTQTHPHTRQWLSAFMSFFMLSPCFCLPFLHVLGCGCRALFSHLPRRTGPDDETNGRRLFRPLLMVSGVWVSGLVRAVFGVGDCLTATNRSHSWTFARR